MTELETLPADAGEVFGERLALAERFAALLGREGVLRGLLGPREPARLWSRHLLNCAAITDLFPADVRVVDVGSGAGLPGLVIAIRRPDVTLDLVEPMQRRVDFLCEAVSSLGLTGQVRVHRGRAEDATLRPAIGAAAWVTARAVAPLDRLARWCAPLLRVGGQLAVFKGATADQEIAAHGAVFRRLGLSEPTLVQCGAPLVQPGASVVLATRVALRSLPPVRKR